MDKRAIKEHFCYRELSHGPCNVVKQELICAAISVISLRRNGASFMTLRPINTTPPPHLYQLPPTSTPALLNPHPYRKKREPTDSGNVEMVHWLRPKHREFLSHSTSVTQDFKSSMTTGTTHISHGPNYANEGNTKSHYHRHNWQPFYLYSLFSSISLRVLFSSI